MKKLIIIKIGGGLIAPKNWGMETVNEPILKQICEELGKIFRQEIKLIVVCGSGNFGHAAVKKFGISDKLSAAKVQNSAQKIGEIVTNALLFNNLPATLVAPHDLWPAGDAKIVSHILKKDLVPVLFGDVIWEENGAEIYSGEKCISALLADLIKDGFRVEKIIHAGEEEGVLDGKLKVVAEIGPENWKEVKKNIGSAKAIDVTGGMMHKVEESLEILKKFGIESLIINGGASGRILSAVKGLNVVGTKVK